jgi:hypothetical protein
MNRISYSGHRFPPEIIQQAIWLYLRFTLSLRDVEDLLAAIALSPMPPRSQTKVDDRFPRHSGGEPGAA